MKNWYIFLIGYVVLSQIVIVWLYLKKICAERTYETTTKQQLNDLSETIRLLISQAKASNEFTASIHTVIEGISKQNAIFQDRLKIIEGKFSSKSYRDDLDGALDRLADICETSEEYLVDEVGQPHIAVSVHLSDEALMKSRLRFDKYTGSRTCDECAFKPLEHTHYICQKCDNAEMKEKIWAKPMSN